MSLMPSRADATSCNPDVSSRESPALDFYAKYLVHVQVLLSKWIKEKSEENSKDLWRYLMKWNGTLEFEEQMMKLPSIGEIGWVEGNVWHPIPLSHRFPIACPPQYDLEALQWSDEERRTIRGTQIEGFTRSVSCLN